MTTHVFHKSQIASCTFTAALLADQPVLFIANERSRLQFRFDGELEIRVRGDDEGTDRLAIVHPDADAPLFLSRFSAIEIAAIRRSFGIPIQQSMHPSMCTNSFYASAAWISLKQEVTENEAAHAMVAEYCRSPIQEIREWGNGVLASLGSLSQQRYRRYH